MNKVFFFMIMEVLSRFLVVIVKVVIMLLLFLMEMVIMFYSFSMEVLSRFLVVVVKVVARPTAGLTNDAARRTRPRIGTLRTLSPPSGSLAATGSPIRGRVASRRAGSWRARARSG